MKGSRGSVSKSRKSPPSTKPSRSPPGRKPRSPVGAAKRGKSFVIPSTQVSFGYESAPSHMVLLRAPIANVASAKVDVTSFEYNGKEDNVRPTSTGFVACVEEDAQASVMRVFPNADVSLSTKRQEIPKGSLVTTLSVSVARSPKRVSSTRTRTRQSRGTRYVPLPRVVVGLRLMTGRGAKKGFPKDLEVSKELEKFSERCANRLKKRDAARASSPARKEIASRAGRAGRAGGDLLSRTFLSVIPKRSLRPHQVCIARRIHSVRAASPNWTFLIIASMGSGKTLMSIASAFSPSFFPNDFLRGETCAGGEGGEGRTYMSAPSLVVIVAPETVIPFWIEELGRTPQSSSETPQELTTFRVMSTTAFRNWVYGEKHIPEDAILIADEIQSLRNLSDKMRDVVYGMMRFRGRILLSGTPIMNSVDDARSLFAIALNNMEYIETDANNGFLKDIPDPSVLAEDLRGKMAWYDPAISEPSNLYLYPIVDHVKEIVEMSWEQTFLYFAVSESSYQVGDCVMVTPNCNSYDSLTRRACNIVSHKSVKKTFSAKLDAVVASVFRLSGEKKRQVVYSHYLTSGAHFIRDALASLGIKNFDTMDGSVSVRDRSEMIRRYNEGETDLLVMSNVGGVGISLKRTDIFHLVEPAGTLAARDQIVARVARMFSHCVEEGSYGTEAAAEPRSVVTVHNYLATFPTKNPVGAELLHLGNTVRSASVHDITDEEALAAVVGLVEKYNGDTADRVWTKRNELKDASISPLNSMLRTLGDIGSELRRKTENKTRE